MPPQQQQNPWHRRLHRLIFIFGAGSAAWYLMSYMLDRMREARIRASKERRERDLMKNHFTSLSSTLSFTLYALLPTLAPQLSNAYPVELTSQALQGLVTPDTGSTPDQSLVLPSQVHTPEHSRKVGESWASEFGTADSVTSGEMVDASIHNGGENDDAASSVLSQSISLPPTDTSFSPSPPSENAHLDVQSSPPQPGPHFNKSKKELWRDLKLQTITRTLTTAYLVPLLYLLTTSQLAILARLRYLADVKESVVPSPDLNPSRLPSSANDPDSFKTRRKRATSWFSGLSISSLGLSEFVDASTPSILPLPNPINLLPSVITSRIPSIPFISVVAPRTEAPTSELLSLRREEEEAERAEAERVFLTYSWWVLHEGWREIAGRVETGVERVFGGMALKRELTLKDWENLIRDVRASVETSSETAEITLYDFAQHLLPPTPLPPTSSDSCPLPTTTQHLHPHLIDLLTQSSEHLGSPDAKYLIDKGVSAMVSSLMRHLEGELYSDGSGNGYVGDTQVARRLVDCLPVLDRWGKDVWENIPDNGVEALLAVKEFDNFAALIFGDWAAR
ncbi:Peroxin-3 [Naematelia encephala]|uniref:Peroxin-3 n=1 Tax=Naematelia encephala TaxID=71784 RepID=A0A1Y2B2B4_9TREE|nr:Peroxin-3 [Naematelia encephala]